MIVVSFPAIGLTLTNTTPPPPGVPYLSNLSGWFRGVGTTLEVETRPHHPGAFDDETATKRARFITVEGRLTALGDPFIVTDLNTQLMGLYEQENPFDLVVTDPRRTLTSRVRLGPNGIDEVIINEKGIAEFEIPLVAADPLRYGPAETRTTALPSTGGGMVFDAPASPTGTFDFGPHGTTGRVTLSNDGNAPVHIDVHITGTLDSGFSVTCLETGHHYYYTRVVPAGSTVAIRGRSGEVLIDGQSDGSAWFRDTDGMFTIPPRSTRTLQFNTISTANTDARMSVTAASGWN